MNIRSIYQCGIIVNDKLVKILLSFFLKKKKRKEKLSGLFVKSQSLNSALFHGKEK